MQVGSLVKLNSIVCDRYTKLRGIVLKLLEDREGYPMASVAWTDGDKTKEWREDLEVVCK